MKLGLIALCLFFSSVSLASRTNPCENNFASIRLSKLHAQSFADTTRIISSMPMQGHVVYTGTETAIVKVFVDKDFARRHGVDSFDVAKKLKSLAGSRPEWRGAYVQAFTCSFPFVQEADTSNAGSIGHGGK